jgi:hypothetical protein
MNIHRGLSYEEYSDLPGITSTLLKLVSKTTLKHARAYLDGSMARESDALDFGHSFHELLLRGKEDFAVYPATYTSTPEKVMLTTEFDGEWSPQTKVCRQWKASFEAQGYEVLTPEQLAKASEPKAWNWNSNTCKAFAAKHAGKIIHSEEEASSIRSMVAAVRTNEELLPYLDGDTEIAITSERKGEPVKCLVDLLT